MKGYCLKNGKISLELDPKVAVWLSDQLIAIADYFRRRSQIVHTDSRIEYYLENMKRSELMAATLKKAIARGAKLEIEDVE